MSSSYEALKALHVLAAAIWMGAGFLQLLLAHRARADEAQRGWMTGQMEFTGTRLFPVAAGIALLTGIGMVLEADLSFGDAWISLAIVGWLVTMFTGAVLLDRAVKAASAGAAGAYERVLLIARFDLLVIALVVVDMVVKPA